MTESSLPPDFPEIPGFTPPTLGNTIGMALMKFALEGHLTQEGVARRAREAGLPMSRDVVASLLTRPPEAMGLGELALLSRAFDVPLAAWIVHDGWIRFGKTGCNGWVLRELLNGKRPSELPGHAWVPLEAVGKHLMSAPTEAERAAAKKLGVTPKQVHETASHLWGMSLDGRRDLLLGEESNVFTRRAKRGHITRRLLGELADRLTEGRNPA